MNEERSVENRKAGLRKIGDLPGQQCKHPEHTPSTLGLEPGKYEYVCPGCNLKTIFTVKAATR